MSGEQQLLSVILNLLRGFERLGIVYRKRPREVAITVIERYRLNEVTAPGTGPAQSGCTCVD